MQEEQIIHTITMMDEEQVAYGISNVPKNEVSRIEYMAVNKSLLLYLKSSKYKFQSEQTLIDYPKTNSKGERVGGFISGPYMKAQGSETAEVIAAYDFNEVKAIWEAWNPGKDSTILEKMHMSILEVIEKAKEKKKQEEEEQKKKQEEAKLTATKSEKAKSPILGADGSPAVTE